LSNHHINITNKDQESKREKRNEHGEAEEASEEEQRKRVSFWKQKNKKIRTG
jgi:hypothetical protein